MKLFTKRDHFDKFTPIGLYIVSCILTVIIWLCNGISLFSGIVWVFFTLIATVLLCKYLGSLGLYIVDGKIYYKLFRCKEVDVQKIAAIRITKTVARTNSNPLFHPRYDWKDMYGNQMYSMIFYHEYLPLSMHENDLGDCHFIEAFIGSVLFWTVYDKAVLDYITSVNPDIIVIPADGGAPPRKPGPMHGLIVGYKFRE